MRKPLVVVLLLGALVLAGCGGNAAGQTPGGEQGFVSGDGSIVVLDPSARPAAPALSGATLDGSQLSTADLIGDVVVINVWASWCAPCRAEAPDLEQVWQATQAGGVQFVGVNTRDSDAAAKAFVAKFGLTYPQLVDPAGRLQLLFRDSLPPQAIPSTVVLDKQGRVAARLLGAAPQNELLGVIEQLVAEPAAGPTPAPVIVQP